MSGREELADKTTFPSHFTTHICTRADMLLLSITLITLLCIPPVVRWKCRAVL